MECDILQTKSLKIPLAKWVYKFPAQLKNQFSNAFIFTTFTHKLLLMFNFYNDLVQKKGWQRIRIWKHLCTDIPPSIIRWWTERSIRATGRFLHSEYGNLGSVNGHSAARTNLFSVEYQEGGEGRMCTTSNTVYGCSTEYKVLGGVIKSGKLKVRIFEIR